MTDPVFFCTWPTVWPDEALISRGGAPSPTCWARFDTMTDRGAHYRAAHPELVAAGAFMRPVPAVAVVAPGDWHCIGVGCTAPLSAHPVEMAARAARAGRG